jgi:hypothetical protein
MTETIWAAVRRDDDGEEWVDLSSAAYLKTAAETEAKQPRGRNAAWLKKNPVVRIGKFKLEEIPSSDLDGREDSGRGRRRPGHEPSHSPRLTGRR